MNSFRTAEKIWDREKRTKDGYFIFVLEVLMWRMLFVAVVNEYAYKAIAKSATPRSTSEQPWYY